MTSTPESSDAAAAEALAPWFESRGATPLAARTMALQLVRRARQLAVERGQTPAEALARLLAAAAAGHDGRLPDGWPSGGEAPLQR